MSLPPSLQVIAEAAKRDARSSHTNGAAQHASELTDAEPWSPGAIVDSWLAHGPLVHEPTGISALDKLTGGGPVYGSRWYLLGAPDAGKTALLLQIAHVFALRGICVGILA